MKDQSDALVQWIVEQQRASSLSQKQPPELHLHQHHHPTTPPPVADFERRRELPHPLITAAFMLFVSVAVSLPLALLAAIVDSSNRPDVQYVQPQRSGW